MATEVFSPKERLTRVLHGEKVERPPVICPGGMMNAAIVEVMEKENHVLPAAHHSADKMADLALDVHKYTGFENFGISFCMTIEAEALGSEINYGTLECEPKIQKEKYPSVTQVDFKPYNILEKNNRAGAVVQTIYELSRKYPDVPAIGSLTGPISTAASIVDPTATGEILGPKMFEEYAVPYLNKLVDGIHEMGIPAIIHICGHMEMVKSSCAKFHSNALSVDAFVSLKKIKDEYNQITTMGNLSTILLEQGNESTIEKQAERLVHDNINIIAPACGLSTSTPLENLTAFTQTVKNS